MIPDFSGDYLNYDSTKPGQIYTIVQVPKSLEYNEKLKKDMYNLKVRLSEKDKVKTFSPNNTQGKALQDAFGEDDNNWTGKQFEILHVEKRMLIRPIKT